MGQTLTQSSAVLNDGVALAFNAAQAANNVVMSKDDCILILVKNANDAVQVETATVTISPGDGWKSVLGTLTEEVADNGTIQSIGPLESARFKNSAGNVVVNVALTQGGTLSSVTLAVLNLSNA